MDSLLKSDKTGDYFKQVCQKIPTPSIENLKAVIFGHLWSIRPFKPTPRAILRKAW